MTGKNPAGTPALMPGAEPFFFRAGEIGCLLIHGFKGSPDCLREMGKYLARAGISTLGVRLHGHGTNLGELDRCCYRDWIVSAEEGLEELGRRCRAIFVAGISMGGAIALHLACHHPGRVQGVIAMATPYDMPRWMKILAPPLKRIRKNINPLKSLAVRNTSVKVACYNQISLPAAHQLFKLIDMVRPGLPRVTCPALLIFSRLDRAVPARSACRIFEALGSADKRLFWVERSGHMVTLDYDKGLVFKQAEKFIREKAGPLKETFPGIRVNLKDRWRLP